MFNENKKKVLHSFKIHTLQRLGKYFTKYFQFYLGFFCFQEEIRLNFSGIYFVNVLLNVFIATIRNGVSFFDRVEFQEIFASPWLLHILCFLCSILPHQCHFDGNSFWHFGSRLKRCQIRLDITIFSLTSSSILI